MRASGISSGFPGLSQSLGQVAHVLLTRSPLGLPEYCYSLDPVRLACVKHAASVRPEPESNSPSKPTRPKPRSIWFNSRHKDRRCRPLLRQIIDKFECNSEELHPHWFLAHLCSVVKEHHRRLAHTSREVEVLESACSIRGLRRLTGVLPLPLHRARLCAGAPWGGLTTVRHARAYRQAGTPNFQAKSLLKRALSVTRRSAKRFRCTATCVGPVPPAVWRRVTATPMPRRRAASAPSAG
jgi:hypothetical protein